MIRYSCIGKEEYHAKAKAITIEGKLAEIQIQRRKIIEYIDGIDDSLLRQIIFPEECIVYELE